MVVECEAFITRNPQATDGDHRAHAPPKPCEYFDIIGRTSTGGLIAIMLDRLEMDIDECIDAYVALFDQVFQKMRHRVTINGYEQGRFDTEELERSFREIIKRKDKAGENALLKGSGNQQCKMFVPWKSHLFQQL